MASKHLDKERQEDICAAIACKVLGARYRRRDLRGVAGGPSASHDFDLEFSSGQVEALEVCFFTNPTVRAQWSAIRALDVEAQSLANSWTIGVREGAMIKGLPENAEPHLLVLEQNGVDRFIDSDYLEGRARRVADGLLVAYKGLIDLGVIDATVAPTPTGESPRIVVAAGVGGAGTSDLVNRAVEDRASETGNRKKLAASGASRCHLFIPIDVAAGVVWNLVRHELPKQPPSLPPEVDMAWVIGSGARVLFVEPPRPWQSAVIDPSVWADPTPWRA